MAKQREDYERGAPVAPIPVDQQSRYRELELEKITLGSGDGGRDADRIFVAFAGDQAGLFLGYVIDNKDQADELINILIDARNRLWPTP